MIDLQPTMSIQHDAEAERGFAHWHRMEAIRDWCVEFRALQEAARHAAREEFRAELNAEIRDAGLFVINLCNYRRR